MMRMSWIPAPTACSTTNWMAGLSTSGSISLGCAFVAGRKRVPSPAAGMTAFLTLIALLRKRAVYPFRDACPARSTSSPPRDFTLYIAPSAARIFVSDEMPELVVQLLEPVDVDHEHRHGTPVSASTLDLSRQRDLQESPIAGPGQGVRHRKALRLLVQDGVLDRDRGLAGERGERR